MYIAKYAIIYHLEKSPITIVSIEIDRPTLLRTQNILNDCYKDIWCH